MVSVKPVCVVPAVNVKLVCVVPAVNMKRVCCASGEYQAALKVQQDYMQTALDEVDAYCEFNRWLNEIHVYCRRWNDRSTKEFRGAAAFTIEVDSLFLLLDCWKNIVAK